MSPIATAPPVTARALRALLGSTVRVRTLTTAWEGTLLSCLEHSAWFVVDDTDVMVDLDDIVAFRAA